MDYKLFQKTTEVDDRGKRIGILVNKKPELREEVKNLRKKFNEFTNMVCKGICNTNNTTEQWSMAHRDGNHYKPYFWNQFKSDFMIDGVSIWLKLDTNRLGIIFGTTNKLKNYKPDVINKKIWDKYGHKSYKQFEKTKTDEFLNYNYKGSDEKMDIEIFKQILKDMLDNYKDLMKSLEEKCSIPKNKTTENSQNKIAKIKNIILYGVPGVGKTYSHKKLIDMIEDRKFSENEIFSSLENHNKTEFYDEAKEQNRVKFITFHQSFGYEDFIEGFRPNEDGDIKLQDGVFKAFCNEAKKQSDKNFYFVIDEINRANISKVFGELITLIEEDKRETLSVTLPYSKELFSIPKNIYIIGTMNSTDKSIALIDIALRRRFTFLKMIPKLELVKKYPKAQEIMKNLNEKIKESLGEDYQVGHSYFMDIEDEEDLTFTCKYKIKPLLEEYFYGDKEGFDRVYEVIKDA